MGEVIAFLIGVFCLIAIMYWLAKVIIPSRSAHSDKKRKPLDIEARLRQELEEIRCQHPAANLKPDLPKSPTSTAPSSPGKPIAEAAKLSEENKVHPAQAPSPVFKPAALPEDSGWRRDLAATIREKTEYKAPQKKEKNKSGPPDEIQITDDFKQALDLMEKKRQCLFITGKAGTGKSTLLTHFRTTTRKKLVVLAPTGVAAVNIRGQTIHSFFSFPPQLLTEKNIKIYPKLRDILKRTEVIIIDEISMVRADLMDCIDLALRRNLEDERPFGGRQMIFFGDLYQLPPVLNDDQVVKYINDKYGGPFFFNVDVFKHVDFKILELRKIFRQRDEDFINILNEVRENSLTAYRLANLNRRLHQNRANLTKGRSLILCSTNSKAAEKNSYELGRLKSKAYTYHAEIKDRFNIKDCPAEEQLELKVGAQIMMLKNDPDKRWVNGTLGVVHELSKGCIKVDLDGTVYEVGQAYWEAIQYVYDSDKCTIEAEVVGSCCQYPLKLAWAVTIHKSQGQTLDRVVIDLGENGAFTHGQTYVALSRCATFEGLSLAPDCEIRPRDIILDPAVVKFGKENQLL
jgi:ATP-dependent exoDNAse (exonuclease V) alpha subunit